MNTPQLPDLPIFRTIAEAAHELGQPAYVIGGYVRDLALQRGSKDIDVVTVGDGIQLAQAVGRKLPGRGRVTVFKNFGTAMLPTQEAGEAASPK
jgi:poly(A) polymerase